MKERLTELDLLKGIAIIGIVYGHIGIDTTCASKLFFYAFHVPVFFIISGILLSLKYAGTTCPDINIGKHLMKRLRQLMLPYFAFEIIYIAIHVLLAWITTGIIFTGYAIDSLTHTIRLLGLSAVWFLPAYFIAEMLFVVALKHLPKALMLMLIAIIMASTMLPENYFDIMNEQWYMLVPYRALVGFSFVGIGFYLYPLVRNVLTLRNAVAAFIVAVCLAFVNGKIDTYSLKFQFAPLYFLNATAISLSLLTILKSLGNANGSIANIGKAILFYGKNSIVVLCTHVLFVEPFAVIDENYTNGFFNGTFPGVIIATIIVIIIEIPTTKLLNGPLRFLIGK